MANLLGTNSHLNKFVSPSSGSAPRTCVTQILPARLLHLSSRECARTSDSEAAVETGTAVRAAEKCQPLPTPTPEARARAGAAPATAIWGRGVLKDPVVTRGCARAICSETWQPLTFTL